MKARVASKRTGTRVLSPKVPFSRPEMDRDKGPAQKNAFMSPRKGPGQGSSEEKCLHVALKRTGTRVPGRKMPSCRLEKDQDKAPRRGVISLLCCALFSSRLTHNITAPRAIGMC